ncbi:erythromycin esterase family protein [Nocardioides antri]|uniref:Erythromycin esterase family protein n=1 Tax=Nocardioides antri TaxID=2607659 RepID=A0A5B1LZK0_9ACTN|nr:erythromycin esterase family protein [Nocardioides antri]KAA1425876.1 erythromycin esterase family protein [Nocardioides antri]
MTRDEPGDIALPLRHADDLDPLLTRVGDARIVCIGEASHGTHEYYAWRATLTKRLIQEKGFDLVAVEGDWPDCYEVNRSVVASGDSRPTPEESLANFVRWPTWMWANQDVLDFTRWLREANQTRPEDERVRFYGLDVYSLWESLREVLDYLAEHHPAEMESALTACRCFEPYAEDPQTYAAATRFVPDTCEAEVIDLLSALVDRRRGAVPDADGDPEAAFAAEQNARAVVDAEAYYRAMVRGGPDSWNIRDTHMADTLDQLLAHHDGRRTGRRSKAVVWEHNTHVGDARHTDMRRAGLVNVGQLVRERHGESDCVLVGFGSHRGTVVAAEGWGRPHAVMQVPPARAGSTEELLHASVPYDAALFVFGPTLPEWAAERRDHRAIGVVYRPTAERWGNYVPTVLGRRYDAFLWVDRTTALAPLAGTEGRTDELETWPFGA